MHLYFPASHQYRLAEVSKLSLPLVPPPSPPSDHTGQRLTSPDLSMPVLSTQLIKQIPTCPSRIEAAELRRLQRRFDLSCLEKDWRKKALRKE
ncbi:hypothetical protein MJO29_010555 [Puccinia striiformis f. sp. tritici]|nr:hypothetical protein MJO29_010555 [Puccinia striiformis f. sp. tritici]